MGHIVTVTGTGVEVYVLLKDHCPPHVHCEHQADGWEAKMEFSFLDNSIALTDLFVTGKRPALGALNTVRSTVGRKLKNCRDDWWAIYGNTCLTNKWLLRTKAGLIYATKKQRKNAVQVNRAIYDPTTGKTTLIFNDGTIGRAL